MKSFKYQKCAAGYLWFGNEILLAKRINGTFANHYTCPAGKIEDGEDILSGLIREIKEETNFKIKKKQLKLIDCYFLPDRRPPKKVFVFESLLPSNYYDFYFGENPEPHKHEDWMLYTRKEALKLKLMPNLREYLLNIKLD